MTIIRLMTTQTLMTVGTGRLEKAIGANTQRFLRLLCFLILLGAQEQTVAQEALLPIRHTVSQLGKGGDDMLSLPFFDESFGTSSANSISRLRAYSAVSDRRSANRR